MTYPQGTPLPPAQPARPAAWLPDPLDNALVRYWDGHRWTFHTPVRRTVVPVEVRPLDQAPAVPALRPDVAQALERVRGALVGSMKEVNLLGGYLGPEERVLALTSAQGEGLGVLACTNQRLLFLFAVYTTKPTKRATPAMAVRVGNPADAQAVVQAAQAASAAPRLDVV